MQLAGKSHLGDTDHRRDCVEPVVIRGCQPRSGAMRQLGGLVLLEAQNNNSLSAQTAGSPYAAHLSIRCTWRRVFGGGSSHLARLPDCPDQASHGCHTTGQRPVVETTTRLAWEITRALSGLSNRVKRGELQEASEMGRFGGEVETGVGPR